MSSKTNKKKVAAPSSSLKQGNLFSFFSKKPAASSSSTPKPKPKPKSSSTPSSVKATPSTKANNKKKASTVSPSPSTASSKFKTKTTPSLSQSSAASSSSSDTSNNNSNTNTNNNNKWKQVSLNCRVSVYWPDDKEYYKATVTKQRGSSSNFFLEYDDDTTEWIDLSTEEFKLLLGNDSDEDGDNEDGDKQEQEDTNTNNNSNNSNAKRRRIEEEDDDEDEFEFGDAEVESEDDDDDGSVYDPKSAPKEKDDDLEIDDAAEEEDDQCMITDDDEEVTRPAKKKLKKSSSLKVTRVSGSNTSKNTSMTTSSLSQFANTVSPPQNNNNNSNSSSPEGTSSPTVRRPLGTTPPFPRPEITPPPKQQSRDSNSFITMSKSQPQQHPNKPLPYVKGAVNERGAHVHNHLKFLQDPKDASGKRPGEPGYDPRTLQVRHADWERHVGKMTNAVAQWWELKSQYFDTVLLFKTGKFYEMFHMDADIGVDICGFNYMKGHVAHAGFPEISYGQFSDKLVRAGYKVARVEQTETPDMLKERKARTKSGQKKPQVVNREVCSILTLGTRTFCALDDVNALLMDDSGSGSDGANGGIGPLLAIREVLVDDTNDNHIMETDDNDDQVRPVCEYGITVVDAVRAVITVGQFADDVLRSRMNTLLMALGPSEILVQDDASPTLLSLLKSYRSTSRTTCRMEVIQTKEKFPKSTALDASHRRQLERQKAFVQPWDVQETLGELHRRGYYPRGSRNSTTNHSTSRWPKVLQAVVEGQADLCLSSFGAALFYLQRNLIDYEILSMGIVKAYIPPASSCVSATDQSASLDAAMAESQEEDADDNNVGGGLEAAAGAATALANIPQVSNAEGQIKHMSLDGTTLHNLEILTNSVDHKVAGSLWSKINYTKSPHGSRLLRAWLLRPLFRKADIERRGDAVQELVAGAGAVALNEARQGILGKVGDLERLLSRIHSMTGTSAPSSSSEDAKDDAYHPSERAVLYESATYTKRKVGDFSKVLNGLRLSCQIPEIFAGLELKEDGLLRKVVRLQSDGGCFPCMSEELDWFFENFDTEKAARGLFEPARGMDDQYDDACDAIARILDELEEYRLEMCSQLSPRHVAKSAWKYINTKPDSKDKYLIELPASLAVPDDFIVKAKRGSGAKQINKYRTSVVARLVQDLEQAFEVQAARKAKGMQLIFAKFDAQRPLWAAAAHATAILDAVGSLAKTACKPGFCRPTVLECPPDLEPTINIVQGRHPCVETSVHSTEFIPNDLCLGRAGKEDSSRLLLLSGPNMGGKSTLLRQTCLITILAQIGSYVPAESCELTPIDCIYTRLGASDRILLGQSTFFVELAETAAALRGATRRSLVIMDELGRGTSTFDGTAIAGATVKHLIERSQCISLFATHYHSLLDEWEDEPKVRLGHMQCVVEDNDNEETTNETGKDSSITFLYSLGPGTCPKSFGINVARLASLPAEVLSNAKRASEEFEKGIGSSSSSSSTGGSEHESSDAKQRIRAAIDAGDWDGLQRIWESLKQ